jgi:hypothetical protein
MSLLGPVAFLLVAVSGGEADRRRGARARGAEKRVFCQPGPLFVYASSSIQPRTPDRPASAQ